MTDTEPPYSSIRFGSVAKRPASVPPAPSTVSSSGLPEGSVPPGEAEAFTDAPSLTAVGTVGSALRACALQRPEEDDE